MYPGSLGSLSIAVGVTTMKTVTYESHKVNTLPDRSVTGLYANTSASGYIVRLAPDLSASALKTKQDKEYALWLCLRALNYSGSGYIDLEPAIEKLYQVFGYKRRTVFATLELGEGVFWTRIAIKRGTTIKIKSLKDIALMFGTPLFNIARFYEVPADKFQTLKSRRQSLWASIHKPKGVKANPISRESLETYTGIQRRRQQRYDKSGQVARTPCYRPEFKQQPRLPNIYHNKSERGHTGMLIKVRRLIRSFKTDEALEPRRYFNSMRKMIKTTNRVELSYVLISNYQRRIKGRLEWQPVLCMGI